MQTFLSKISLKTAIGLLVSGLVIICQFFGVNIHDLIPSLTAAIGNFVNAALGLYAVFLAFKGHLDLASEHAALVASSQTPGTALSSLPPVKRSPLLPAIVVFCSAIGGLGLTGCAATGTTGASISADIAQAGPIVGDIITDVTTGAIAVSDAATALSAAQQTMGGHGVSLSNVGAYATAEASAINTSGLSTAVTTLTKDISSQLSAGASQAAITSQLTAAQNALSAVAPVAPATSTATPPTTLWMQPHRQSGQGVAIVEASF